MICSDTGDWHGKILDFEASPFGKQDITFKRMDIHGNIYSCFRKSKCIPYRIGKWIILVKRRRGHESGLLQHNFSHPTFKLEYCKEGWEK